MTTNETTTRSVPDTIERELVLPHPIERVWRAITDTTELAAWFGDTATFELRPGAEGMFTWGDDHSPMVVEAVEEPHRFAYWWTSGASQSVTPEYRTLVDFRLEPTADGGTRLRLDESGFAALANGPKQHADNVDGWDIELGELTTHLGDGS